MRVYMLTPVLRQQMNREIRQKLLPIAPIPTDTPPELRQMGDIRCVAFDVYGTLLVSAAGEIGTAQEASAGVGPFAEVAHLLGLPRTLEGTLAETYYRIIAEYHDQARRHGSHHPEVDIRKIWRKVLATVKPHTPPQPEWVALSYELTANPVWPMPGAQRLLRGLVAHGMRVALVSNAQFYTPIILEVLFGTSLKEMRLHPCVWSYEIGEAKPAALPFHHLINSLRAEGIEPGETLYVGNDMLNDIVTAQDQGLRGILFAGDSRSLRRRGDMDTIRNRTPDAVITALDQLPAVIGIGKQ